MFVYCGEESLEYLMDTTAEKVYALNVGDNGEIISYKEHGQEMQNFLRWHPYLEAFKETEERPVWLKE